MRKQPRPEQIASILREVQAALAAGLNVDQACRKAGMPGAFFLRTGGATTSTPCRDARPDSRGGDRGDDQHVAIDPTPGYPR
jgi:hypothetical protein